MSCCIFRRDHVYVRDGWDRRQARTAAGGEAIALVDAQVAQHCLVRGSWIRWIWTWCRSFSAEGSDFVRIAESSGAVDPLISATERADELRRAAMRASVELVLLEGGNHYFDDRHAELAACIVDWLARADG